MTRPEPYAPPPLAPVTAALRTALSSRRAFQPGAGPLEFVYEPAPAPWPARAALTLSAGGALWLMELGGLNFLPAALAGADPAALPEDLLAAAAALAAQPWLDRLAEGLGAAVEVEPEATETAWLSPPLHFLFRFQAADGRVFPTPLRLRASTEAGGFWLADKISRLPAWLNPARADWPIPAVLEAGRMALPRALLAGLAESDILLPPDYPAARGRLTLRLPGGGLRLKVEAGRAEALDWSPEELPMSSDNLPEAVKDGADPGPPEAAEGGLDLDRLEVVVSFELEKKRLTLAELQTLAPGRGFPLGVDPLAPVTLTVNGLAIGAGRLVDLGGTLGVEVTRVVPRKAGD
ncbi:MAG: type III secretion system cytoplasmic ring protein SctQ [Candidatus Adiutrix sp.]|nr:type III secretion system cytoplasmic ring protein SctQ [Candidatus Adiutrix sp.]